MDEIDKKIKHIVLGLCICSIFFVPVTIEMELDLKEKFILDNETSIPPTNVKLRITAPIYLYGFSIIKDKIIDTVEYLEEIGY